jgi:hypothetical protein
VGDAVFEVEELGIQDAQAIHRRPPSWVRRVARPGTRPAACP